MLAIIIIIIMAQVAQDNGYIFIPAIFSHTGQIHKEVMDLMFKQIKGKLELDDEQVQNSKIMGMHNLWVKQISCVINRTASRNIMAGRAALVEALRQLMLHQKMIGLLLSGMIS